MLCSVDIPEICALSEGKHRRVDLEVGGGGTERSREVGETGLDVICERRIKKY